MPDKRGNSQSADNSQLLAHKSSPKDGHAFKLQARINVFMRSRYKDVPNEKKKRIRENIINYYKRFGIKGLPARYAISGIMYLLFPIAYANVIYRIYIRS